MVRAPHVFPARFAPPSGSAGTSRPDRTYVPKGRPLGYSAHGRSLIYRSRTPYALRTTADDGGAEVVTRLFSRFMSPDAKLAEQAHAQPEAPMALPAVLALGDTRLTLRE